MAEAGMEFRRPSLGERIRARMEYTFNTREPVSKEVTRQITKIQSAIPYGRAWEAFENVKLETPGNMTATDAEFRTQSLWHNLTKLAKLAFYSPMVVLMDGPSPASRERKKIRKTAKEWRKFLTKDAQGKSMIAEKNGKVDQKRIREIVSKIIAGQGPKDRNEV